MAKSKKVKPKKITLRQQMAMLRHFEWLKNHSLHEGPQKAAIVASRKAYKRPSPGSKRDKEE